jgi:hypothetical protein
MTVNLCVLEPYLLKTKFIAAAKSYLRKQTSVENSKFQNCVVLVAILTWPELSHSLSLAIATVLAKRLSRWRLVLPMITDGKVSWPRKWLWLRPGHVRIVAILC